MPERSPLMSAANTGTPARAKPSAITCRVTVLPVPVAPVASPWRFASASVSQAGCSPLPTKILSAVSAALVLDVAIGPPVLTEPKFRQEVRQDHTACRDAI